jgi:hypothetical protein
VLCCAVLCCAVLCSYFASPYPMPGWYIVWIRMTAAGLLQIGRNSWGVRRDTLIRPSL